MPSHKAIPMTEIDIADDEALRFIQRVLESDAPREDRDRAAQMVRDIRRRVRKVYAEHTPAGVKSPNPACGVHGLIPCEGAQCICPAGVPASDSLRAAIVKVLGNCSDMECAEKDYIAEQVAEELAERVPGVKAADAHPAPFSTWAAGEGYDIAQTYDTERSRWVFLNPMTADLWKAWQAARGVAPTGEGQP